jgi:tRNA (guanine37-N1)-methyltransferase
LRVDVITIIPELVQLVASYGITGRAVSRGILTLEAWNPRDYTTGQYRGVDDRPYGGGPGMVMKVGPLRRCIQAVRAKAPASVKTIYLSPQGRRLEQQAVRAMAACAGLILVAGRYEGVDERLIELEIDEEWSVGDYVLSGGELPAMVLVDAIARLQPAALGDEDSAQQDSFMGGLLDYPHYTRPADIAGLEVPQILLTGNHAAIRRWRHKQALGRTWLRRPELFKQRRLSEQERIMLDEFIQEHDKTLQSPANSNKR